MDAKTDDAFWPDEPYKGLNFYTAKDAPLFCERDDEVDTCAQLIASSSTKMLLLHGRSGTGKSSFLRAGLFTRYLRDNPTLYLLVEDGEPCFIRSTADPIASITDTLLERVSEQRHFRNVSDEVRQQARHTLEAARGSSAMNRKDALRSALVLLTANLVGTFVLVIDQAEEVFTLERRDSSGEEREAYFAFLEDLCFGPFDIKLIITLRTEYYGQFSDCFRVAPSLNVSTVVAGLDQFMLHGVQDPARLQAAIERPTLSQEIEGRVPPREKYRFTYAPGLAQQIAQDIVQHCGESSALPVLQVVCSDLYERLQKPRAELISKEMREVETRDYRSGGEVAGAIDRYIETAIKSALRACGMECQPRMVDGWKHIVSLLVARQEGGALTSLMMKEEDLRNRAREFGIVRQIGQCLRVLSGEKLRLLRCVTLHDRVTGVALVHYSLGHDALAPSLFTWQQTRGKEIEQRVENKRRATAWLARSAVAATAMLLIGLTIVGWFAMRSEADAMRAALHNTKAEPVMGNRILQLASLEMKTSWHGGLLSGSTTEALDSSLRELLISAPIIAMNVRSASLSKDGTRLALLTSDLGVMTKALRASPTSSSVPYPVAIDSNYSTAGFVDGLDQPVVVTPDHICAGPGSCFDIQELVTVSKVRPPITSFETGTLQLQGYPAGEKILLYRLRYDAQNSSFSVGTPTDLAFQKGRFGETPSPYTWTVAYTEGDNRKAAGDTPISLFVGVRTDPHDQHEFRILSNQNNGALRPGAISFLPDGETIAYRDALHRIAFAHYARSEQRRPQLVTLPIVMPQGDPALRPLSIPRRRSVLAAVRTAQGYRVAWLTARGITLVQSGESNQLMPLPGARANLQTSPLYIDPSPYSSTYAQIRFDGAGDFVTLIVQNQSGTVVQVWDISDARAERIGRLVGRELVAEACRVTASSGERVQGNQLSPDEFAKLPISPGVQPCSEIRGDARGT